MLENVYIKLSDKGRRYIDHIATRYNCTNLVEATILGVVLAPLYRMEWIIKERGMYIEQMKRGFAEVKYYVDKINNGLDKMDNKAEEMNQKLDYALELLQQQNQSANQLPAESFQEMEVIGMFNLLLSQLLEILFMDMDNHQMAFKRELDKEIIV